LRTLNRQRSTATKETLMKNVLALQQLSFNPDDPWAISSILSIACDCDRPKEV